MARGDEVAGARLGEEDRAAGVHMRGCGPSRPGVSSRNGAGASAPAAPTRTSRPTVALRGRRRPAAPARIDVGEIRRRGPRRRAPSRTDRRLRGSPPGRSTHASVALPAVDERLRAQARPMPALGAPVTSATLPVEPPRPGRDSRRPRSPEARSSRRLRRACRTAGAALRSRSAPRAGHSRTARGLGRRNR